jgi:hypothetical protein
LHTQTIQFYILQSIFGVNIYSSNSAIFASDTNSSQIDEILKDKGDKESADVPKESRRQKRNRLRKSLKGQEEFQKRRKFTYVGHALYKEPPPGIHIHHLHSLDTQSSE